MEKSLDPAFSTSNTSEAPAPPAYHPQNNMSISQADSVEPANASLASQSNTTQGLQPYLDKQTDSYILPAQTLHLYNSNANRRHSVMLGDDATLLYSCKGHTYALKRAAADLELHRGDFDTDTTAPIVATCKLHNFSDDVLHFPEANMESTLHHDAKLKIRYTTVNPFDGQMYTWKNTRKDTSKFSSGNLKLEDQNGNIIAVFLSLTHKCIKKAGTLEIGTPLKLSTAEWVLITCLALNEKETRGNAALLAAASTT